MIALYRGEHRMFWTTSILTLTSTSKSDPIIRIIQAIFPLGHHLRRDLGVQDFRCPPFLQRSNLYSSASKFATLPKRFLPINPPANGRSHAHYVRVPEHTHMQTSSAG